MDRNKIYEIEVVNWEKYQHHNGSRTYDWFKISGNIFDDPQVEMLTDTQVIIWFKILSVCARYRQRTVNVTLTYLQRNRNVPLLYIERALTTFEQLQWVKIKTGTKLVPQNRIEKKRREENEETTVSGPVKTSHQPIRPAAPVAAATIGFPKEAGRTNESWYAYEAALKKRKPGAKPVRNQKVNGLLARLIDRVGKDEAPKLVAFYVSHNDSWYVRKGHSLECCVDDAEKLLMEMQTGQRVTGTSARQQEADDHNDTVVRNYLAKDAQQSLNLEREVNESGISGSPGNAREALSGKS